MVEGLDSSPQRVDRLARQSVYKYGCRTTLSPKKETVVNWKK